MLLESPPGRPRCSSCRCAIQRTGCRGVRCGLPDRLAGLQTTGMLAKNRRASYGSAHVVALSGAKCSGAHSSKAGNLSVEWAIKYWSEMCQRKRCLSSCRHPPCQSCHLGAAGCGRRRVVGVQHDFHAFYGSATSNMVRAASTTAVRVTERWLSAHRQRCTRRPRHLPPLPTQPLQHCYSDKHDGQALKTGGKCVVRLGKTNSVGRCMCGGGRQSQRRGGFSQPNAGGRAELMQGGERRCAVLLKAQPSTAPQGEWEGESRWEAPHAGMAPQGAAHGGGRCKEEGQMVACCVRVCIRNGPEVWLVGRYKAQLKTVARARWRLLRRRRTASGAHCKKRRACCTWAGSKKTPQRQEASQAEHRVRRAER